MVIVAMSALVLAGCDNPAGGDDGSINNFAGTSWRRDAGGSFYETIDFSSSTWSFTGPGGYTYGTYTYSGNTVTIVSSKDPINTSGTISGDTLYIFGYFFTKQ
jgi:hypothetical protein